jgi:hypothetical protein
MNRSVRPADRSVSVALNYVLVLGITTVLITGLLIAGSTFVGDNREQVIDSELAVIGNHIAGNMEQVDRLVNASTTNAGNDPAVAYINQSFQQQVTGTSYNVEVVDGDPSRVILTSANPSVTVEVNATVRTDVRETAVSGGAISVYYDASTDELVIDDV